MYGIDKHQILLGEKEGDIIREGYGGALTIFLIFNFISSMVNTWIHTMFIISYTFLMF